MLDHLRALLISLHIVAVGAMAMPNPAGFMSRSAWKLPMVQDELMAWAARLTAALREAKLESDGEPSSPDAARLPLVGRLLRDGDVLALEPGALHSGELGDAAAGAQAAAPLVNSLACDGWSACGV